VWACVRVTDTGFWAGPLSTDTTYVSGGWPMMRGLALLSSPLDCLCHVWMIVQVVGNYGGDGGRSYKHRPIPAAAHEPTPRKGATWDSIDAGRPATGKGVF
jgi:hypothetical protein